MDGYAYYNGAFGKREDLSIPLSDRAIFFGDGIYDAALTIGEKIIWEKEHIRRFFENAEALFLEPDFTQDGLKEILQEVVKKSKFDTGFLYFQLSRRLENRIHSARNAKKTSLLVTIEKFTLQNPENLLSLITYPDERYGYCNLKTVNLLPSVLAATAADEKGCDEAVFIRRGSVTECSRSNILIVKDGRVITHPNSNRILPGIARKKVISACRELGVPVDEVAFGKEALFSADEILITSTTKLCLGVKSIDGVNVGGKNPDLRRKIYVELHKEIDEFGKIQ